MRIKGILTKYSVVPVHHCHLILRNPNSLTEQELQELAGVLYEGRGKCKIETLTDAPNSYLLATEFVRPDGNLGFDWFRIDEMSPLNIAQFLFSKQINFLNLPADIAVVE